MREEDLGGGDHVPEEHLFQHGHGRHDTRLATGGECVQLHVRGDERGGEFCVCCSSCTAASDVICDVVDLQRFN